jgi:chromosome partitioning protein
MLVSDVMLTPVRASQFDISTLHNLQAVLEELESVGKELPVYAIINSLKTNPNMPEFTEALEAVEAVDMVKGLPFAIRDRIAFSRTGSEGRGVHEMPDADQKAIAEIETLYQTIYGN